MGKKALAVLASVAATIYILNPTAGVIEFIPDNIPFIGNLDEATATAILIWGVKALFSKKDIEEFEDILDKNND